MSSDNQEQGIIFEARNREEQGQTRTIDNFYYNYHHVRYKLTAEGKSIVDYLPPEITPFAAQIDKIQTDKDLAFLINLITTFAALYPFASASFLTEKFLALDIFDTRLLNLIGLSFGGTARMLESYFLDKGYGEEAATVFQMMSIAGTVGNMLILSLYGDDLAEASAGGGLYLSAMLCNILLSLTLGCYPKIADIARQSPQNAETRELQLNEIAEITSCSMDLSPWQKWLTHTLGQGPVKNIGIASSIVNTAPAFTTLIHLMITPRFGLIYTYAINLAIQILLIIASRVRSSSTYETQLRKQGVSPEKARQVSQCLGQTARAPDNFLDLSPEEKVAFLDAIFCYSAFYSILLLICLIGKTILQDAGMAKTMAAILVMLIPAISSICRLPPAYSLLGLSSSQYTTLCLSIMTMSVLIILLSPENTYWACLILAIANGNGNGIVVNKLTEEAPRQVAAGTAFSTGIAAALAFPFGMAALYSDEVLVIICAITILYSVFRAAGCQPSSPLRALSLFSSNDEARPRQIEMLATSEAGDTEEKNNSGEDQGLQIAL